MMDEKLSSQQFEARDIKRILGINRNRLFYWTQSHRLLTPEVAEAAGTGRRARFSLKNLVELALVHALVDFGTDLRTIRIIKGLLDLPCSQLDNSNVFDFALNTPFKEDFKLLLYKMNETEFIVKVDAVFKDQDFEFDKDGRIHLSPGLVKSFLNFNGDESTLPRYVSLQIDLGRIAGETIAKAEGG
jgi:hypothetical protein